MKRTVGRACFVGLVGAFVVLALVGSAGTVAAGEHGPCEVCIFSDLCIPVQPNPLGYSDCAEVPEYFWQCSASPSPFCASQSMPRCSDPGYDPDSGQLCCDHVGRLCRNLVIGHQCVGNHPCLLDIDPFE